MAFGCPTVDHDGGGGAAPLGHDVAGHAGVVSGIRQLGLGDDEAVVARFIGDAFGDESLFVFQPFHLTQKSNTRSPQTPVLISFNLVMLPPVLTLIK